MTMKLKVISVFLSEGHSDKHIDYSMPRVLALTPFSEFSKGKPGEVGFYKRTGYGSETMEPAVSPEFYPRLLQYFKANYSGDPLILEFTTTLVRRGRGTETVIDGFASPVLIPDVEPISVSETSPPSTSVRSPIPAVVSGGAK